MANSQALYKNSERSLMNLTALACVVSLPWEMSAGSSSFAESSLYANLQMLACFKAANWLELSFLFPLLHLSWIEYLLLYKYLREIS